MVASVTGNQHNSNTVGGSCAVLLFFFRKKVLLNSNIIVACVFDYDVLLTKLLLLSNNSWQRQRVYQCKDRPNDTSVWILNLILSCQASRTMAHSSPYQCLFLSLSLFFGWLCCLQKQKETWILQLLAVDQVLHLSLQNCFGFMGRQEYWSFLLLVSNSVTLGGKRQWFDGDTMNHWEQASSPSIEVAPQTNTIGGLAIWCYVPAPTCKTTLLLNTIAFIMKEKPFKRFWFNIEHCCYRTDFLPCV